MKEDRLIVHFDRDGKILGAYSSLQEASEASGIRIGYIGRNITGTLNDCPDGTKFRYEIKATDLREKKKKLEKEKQDRIAKEWFKDDR